jgi:ATP-dependent helicase/DNAse subunit B
LWEKQKIAASFKFDTQSYGFRADVSKGKKQYIKLPETLALLKTMKYTATRVDTYLNCPLRFYFRYVLGIKEKEKYSDEPGGSEIGSFMHEFLFKAFTPFIGKKPIYDMVFVDGFMRELGKSFDTEFLKRMKAGSLLVKEVVTHRAARFIEKEKERNARIIHGLEKRYTANLEFNGETYNFESRVDRIDELEDGSYLIIDYKTGGTEDIKMRVKLPEDVKLSRETIKKYVGSFQLPIYLELARGNMKGVELNAALYDLRTASLSQFFNENSPEERGERTIFCSKALEYILKEINDPEIPFAADDSSTAKCANCPYLYSCR